MIKEKWLDEILTKQFEMVGLEYKPTLVTHDGWFLEYTWTDEQQNAFKSWLVAYFRKKTRFSKEYCERQAAWFILHCGWKLNNDI